MNTDTAVNAEVQEKDWLISKVREIVANEKFKMDAYFFCGFPSGTPNEKLLKAGEQYLAAVDGAQSDPAATAKLIAELEAAAAAKPDAADNLVNNLSEIREVLDGRELLTI